METTKPHSTEKNMLIALFKDRNSAEKAYNAAIVQGYGPEDINIIMSEEARKKYYDSDLVKIEAGDKSMEGLAVGGALGGTLGGIIGAIAAIGTSLVVPGLGLIIAGPIVAGLAGAGVGSISGGMLGALVGWGIPEPRAQMYEKGIQSGGILLGVNSKNHDVSNLKKEWKNFDPDM